MLTDLQIRYASLGARERWRIIVGKYVCLRDPTILVYLSVRVPNEVLSLLG
jgi:hypothetical protein